MEAVVKTAERNRSLVFKWVASLLLCFVFLSILVMSCTWLYDGSILYEEAMEKLNDTQQQALQKQTEMQHFHGRVCHNESAMRVVMSCASDYETEQPIVSLTITQALSELLDVATPKQDFRKAVSELLQGTKLNAGLIEGKPSCYLDVVRCPDVPYTVTLIDLKEAALHLTFIGLAEYHPITNAVLDATLLGSCSSMQSPCFRFVFFTMEQLQRFEFIILMLQALVYSVYLFRGLMRSKCSTLRLSMDVYEKYLYELDSLKRATETETKQYIADFLSQIPLKEGQVGAEAEQTHYLFDSPGSLSDSSSLFSPTGLFQTSNAGTEGIRQRGSSSSSSTWSIRGQGKPTQTPSYY
jgi:hypothetical protein